MAVGRAERKACSWTTMVTRIHTAPHAAQQLFLLEGWGSEHPVLIGGELAMQSRYESASVPPAPLYLFMLCGMKYAALAHL